MTNAEIARVLREMALFLEMEGVAFKPRAYEKAAHAVEAEHRPLRELRAQEGIRGILGIPGIGKGIAEKIDELLASGRIEELEGMRAATPVDAMELTAVEGLGAKKVKSLHDALGVRHLEDLERAAREGRIRGLPRFGAKSEENILRGIAVLKQSQQRALLGDVLDLAREIEGRLAARTKVERAVVAGSVRRRCSTVGDLDFLVVSARPEPVMDFFVSMPEVTHIYAHGASKAMVRLESGIDADLRLVEAESFGAALHYFTGSKYHNVTLRRLALEQGLKLNEYGVFRGEQRIAGQTEEEVYQALGLPYIPPELREDRGEIEAARGGALPQLIEHGSLRGDLQIQTDWTDGANSIEEMAEAAKALGLEYLAITDHTRDLPVTGGSDEHRLERQIAAIRRIDAKVSGIRLLAGAEVNIRRDGTLDVADETLAKLDVVGAAIHHHFHLPRPEMTRRVVRALENPHVDILFHPTARTLGKREPVDVDVDAIIGAAKRTGTVLEIDGHPRRLDLRDDHVRKAVEARVPLVIDSDAHRVAHLRYADEYGVSVARRGWATARDVLNTRSVEDFLVALKPGSGAT